MKKGKNIKRKLIWDSEGIDLLAKKLKEVRITKGYTQEDLAYESGLSLSQIGRIETSKINPTVSTIFKIARTLKIKPSELLDFKL